MNKKSRSQAVKRLFKESFSGEVLDINSVKNAVNVILRLPYPYSLIILSEYKKQIIGFIDSKLLSIQSASSLLPKDIDTIKSVFMKPHNLLYTQTKIDSSLIAGVKIIAGDYVYDSTIRNNINQITRNTFN